MPDQNTKNKATLRVKLTDSAISAHIPLQTVSVLIDSQLPLLQVRFRKNRTKASWRIRNKNGWHTVGEWPEVKVRSIKANFPQLINQIKEKQEAKFKEDCFETVGELLTWYGDRVAENASLSDQRKADIKSALKCHLMPNLKDFEILDLDKKTLDKYLVWKLQAVMAKSSVVKKFHILKSAFKAAYDLDLIPLHQISSMRISDFGDFSEDDKESNLKPRMVPAFLDELQEQSPFIQMICMLMLTLGTRIGETLSAKWSNFNITSDPCWDIPKKDTKTKAAHTIHFPDEVARMLKRWKQYLKANGHKSNYLFPHPLIDDQPIDYERVRKLIHDFSSGEWRSHDLRKCATLCWEEQQVDGTVIERMLNHKLGKTSRVYKGKAYKARKEALESHCYWLNIQKENCFFLNLSSTLNGNNISDELG